MIPDTMPVSSGWWVTRSGIERSILHEFSVALAWPSGSPRRQTHARHFAALAAHMSQQLPLVEQFSPQCVVGRAAPSPIPMLTFARHAALLGATAPASSSIVAGSISATVSESRAAHAVPTSLTRRATGHGPQYAEQHGTSEQQLRHPSQCAPTSESDSDRSAPASASSAAAAAPVQFCQVLQVRIHTIQSR
jgi:hypothetical protein